MKNLQFNWTVGFCAIAVLLMFIPSALAGTDIHSMPDGWISLNPHDQVQRSVSVSTISSQTPGMKIKVDLSGFSLTRTYNRVHLRDRVSIPNQSFVEHIGAPNLPMIRKIIAVPEGADVNVMIKNGVYEEFYHVMLEPFQRNLLETESEEDREFEIDENIYDADVLYPNHEATLKFSGRFHGIRLATLSIYPFRYNPVTETLMVAKHLDIDLSFSIQNDTTGRQTVKTVPVHLKEVLQSMLFNYDLMNYQVEESHRSVATDYLIISDSILKNSASLNNLVNYYKGEGLNVEVKDVSTLGTTADQIKSYVSQVYNSSPSPQLDFLLLVGDLDVIPFKNNAYNTYASDIWYGWLDGNDQIADVGVGRFPAKNTSELSAMIQKTLDFQKNTYPGAWRNKSILVAHKENYPGKYTECKESIATHNYTLQAPTFDKKYGGDPNILWTNSHVSAAINEGRVVVNYRGHGNYTYWTPWSRDNRSYTTSDVHSLANGNKTPVVFSIACLNADLRQSNECFAEAFIKQNQGAVAFLGANESSYTTVNHDFDRALYSGTWDNGIKTIGDLLNYANSEILSIHGSSVSALSNMTMYLWLGDPALRIRTSGGPVPTEYALTVSVSGQGRVTLDPPGGSYSPGTSVTLTATPDPDYLFQSWSGDLTGSVNPGAITMNSNKNVTAGFSIDSQPNSCVGYCSKKAPGGCWCDNACAQNNDCCADKVQVCGY